MAKKKTGTRPLSRLPVWFIPAGLIAIALAWFIQGAYFPNGVRLSGNGAGSAPVSEIAPVSALKLSEVMSSNRGVWADEDGAYPDWIELINDSDAPYDLTGVTITDDSRKLVKFSFPALTLGPHELVLVYCSGRLRAEAGRGFHAPFKLSGQGDSILIYGADGSILEAVNLPPLGANEVYARENSTGDWRARADYTPGLVNTEENHRLLTENRGVSSSPVRITRIVADNDGSVKDADGDASDWIELRNTGSQPVSLRGYRLSDEPSYPYRWQLPDIALEPGGTVLVFASGKDRAQGELHANFKLNAEGETLTLLDAAGSLVQTVRFELLKKGETLTLNADGSYTVSGR